MPGRNQEIYSVIKSESLEDFYNRLKINQPEVIIPSLGMVNDLGHFNVFKRSVYCSANPSPYNRRDFYKISLIIGCGVLHFPNERIEVKGRALLFTNPNIPYAWEGTSETQGGYFCLFTENFMRNRNESIRESLLYKIHANPLIFIDEAQEKVFMALFLKMMDEMNGEYMHKYDLIRNYINLVVHEALKVQPVCEEIKHSNASVRLSALFMELLERQFPIGSTDHVLELKTANDFAAKLSVHVNHLNHAVKEVTGKTTSEHIAKRIASEAVALLKHTEWNVSQIAYCLGFEYPANFNIFFRRQMQGTPKSFRQISA
ncbi:helix-turn-helix domain-containing protein [Pedobacter nutrimenti]|jgi:AraC-like DNA-binding protein|uniref:AraC-like DNA-binding protein n=1 Tax=Pedobacter nutrimenti TaxID=1241337 RepID=A0A318U6H5_9SPHI|nr:helix-turn-helix transcriptional regulator [Pedobacter nutrimenti]PYF68851.1 AraC-like DNA-binding protein [Pedobacter nutrimenti]|eukprot:gene9319-10925_t